MGLITTIYGDRDDDDPRHERREWIDVDNDHERTTVIEYRLRDTGEVIHRSVSVQLKENVTAKAVAEL